MKCPFCEQEMVAGVMSGDGRSRVYWESSEEKVSTMDKVFGGKGLVESVTYSLPKFKLKADYCPRCKKMIIDTGVTQ